MTSPTVPETPKRRKKGKNFNAEEERQLCCSFLHVSQDPVTENGQRGNTFWDRIHDHYNRNRPPGGGERPARSLESRFGMIKHDVTKFVSCYGSVVALNESGMTPEETLQKSLELYKMNHPKHQSFTFIHCWLVLKDVPRWADMREELKKTPPMERKMVQAVAEPDTGEVVPRWADMREELKTTPPLKRKTIQAAVDLDTGEVEIVDAATFSDTIQAAKRPQGSRAVNEVQKMQWLKICAMRDQARATADMASAKLKKAAILEDQSTTALFTMSDEHLMSEEAREYFKLRRLEELQKLRARLKAVTTTQNPSKSPSPNPEAFTSGASHETVETQDT